MVRMDNTWAEFCRELEVTSMSVGSKPQSAHITTDSLKVKIRTTKLKLNRDVVRGHENCIFRLVFDPTCPLSFNTASVQSQSQYGQDQRDPEPKSKLHLLLRCCLLIFLLSCDDHQLAAPVETWEQMWGDQSFGLWSELYWMIANRSGVYDSC